MTDNFIVSFINNVYIIGTNTTREHNGVKNWTLAGPTMTIPSVIDGKNIEEIGQHAFYRCHNLVEVFISNHIRSINVRAISECLNLKSVIIPPSIEFIGFAGIHAYNKSRDNTADGIMKITFQANSKIQYIDQYGISRKNTIFIYYNDARQFPCHNDPFHRITKITLKIFAPYTSLFCGHTTIHARTCQHKNSYYASIHFFSLLTKES